MKKVLNIFELILIFLCIYFLQANFFNWFTIFNTKPNVFVILVLTIGLFMGRKYGICFGIGFGLIIDCLIGRNIGVTAVMLGIVGAFGGYIDKNFSKDSRITVMMMVAIATIIFEIGQYTIQYITLKYSEFEITEVLKIIFIESIYNIIISIILYPLIKKFGYYIESNFKESNILTRYF